MSRDKFGFLFGISLSLLLSASTKSAVAAAGGGEATKPHTPQEFATYYMESFNKKDLSAIKRLRFPTAVQSEMQKMLDEMSEAELNSGTKYNKFEIKPAPGDKNEATLGPDGNFYKPTIKPTHIVKFTAQTENGSSSVSMPIGIKNGVYYIVTLVPAPEATPTYQYGWNRFTMPQSSWSVLLPNEPEPGRKALEKECGPDALKNPDAYGVVKNTASIKTTQHWFYCGEEGKRVNAPDNKETYRAACTTYEPETLKEWFSDPKKNLDDSVDSRVRESEGKLVQQNEIELNGAPGRDFEIKGKDGSLSLGRSYWIKDSLYELMFQSKKETPDREGANKFLGSLEVK